MSMSSFPAGFRKVDSGAKSPFYVNEKNISEKQGLATRLFRGACTCFSRAGTFCAGNKVSSCHAGNHSTNPPDLPIL
jgi:hypothetical protein